MGELATTLGARVPCAVAITGVLVACNGLFGIEPAVLRDDDSGASDAGTSDSAADVVGEVSPGGCTPGLPCVTTFAGNGAAGYHDDTVALSAEFDEPDGVAVDGAGNVFVADFANHCIRKIDSLGHVSTFAGSGVQGSKNGPGNLAQFNHPRNLAVDAAGNVYVADRDNHSIRAIDSSGNVTTLAGGVQGYADGTAASAMFDTPRGVAVDGAGNVYVADCANFCVRKISGGVVSTLAGDRTSGFLDANGKLARFDFPIGLAIDASGNLYVADYSNSRIRKIDGASNVTTLAGSGVEGFADGPLDSAQFSRPSALAVDASGNVYVAEQGEAAQPWGNRVRKIDPAARTVATLAGNGARGFADGTGGGTGVAMLNAPEGIALDGSGNVLVGDDGDHRIRRITP